MSYWRVSFALFMSLSPFGSLDVCFVYCFIVSDKIHAADERNLTHFCTRQLPLLIIVLVAHHALTVKFIFQFFEEIWSANQSLDHFFPIFLKVTPTIFLFSFDLRSTRCWSINDVFTHSWFPWNLFDIFRLLKMGGLQVNYATRKHEGWRLFSCIWLHAGLVHLFANMLSLIFIGIRLEQEFGFCM